jgi:hypothetical protein
MQPSDPVSDLDATASAERARAGEASPREPVDPAIARIERHDAELGAVIGARDDAARRAGGARPVVSGPGHAEAWAWCTARPPVIGATRCGAHGRGELDGERPSTLLRHDRRQASLAAHHIASRAAATRPGHADRPECGSPRGSCTT